MEYLRWILLVAGLFFVLIVYLIGRNRKSRDTYSDYDLDDEAPEFSANDWDEIEEGVGEVRIVAREESEHGFSEDDEFSDPADPDDYYDEDTDEALDDNQVEEVIEDDAEQKNSKNDIIVLYILARSPDQLAGDKINSAAQANGLVFGKMNIFHRLDDNGQSIFSLANMVEPGDFDPEAMHEIQTSGIILFMQTSAVADPESAFDDMLECAYHISEMLDAQLCNRKRQPLTQSDAEQYREMVAGTDA
jgi:cell division protein ZipA